MPNCSQISLTCDAYAFDPDGVSILMLTNLLIKESPENRQRQEHVGDRLESLHILDESLAVLLLGVVQHGLLLLGLAPFPPFGECVLAKKFQIFKFFLLLFIII